MMDNPHRPSAAGPLLSWDWITPVVYQSARYAPVAVKPEEAGAGHPRYAARHAGTAAAPATPRRPLRPDGTPPRDTATGSVSSTPTPSTLLSGAAGIGKSEVALGLAAWHGEERRTARWRVLYHLRRGRRAGQSPSRSRHVAGRTGIRRPVRRRPPQLAAGLPARTSNPAGMGRRGEPGRFPGRRNRAAGRRRAGGTGRFPFRTGRRRRELPRPAGQPPRLRAVAVHPPRQSTRWTALPGRTG